MQTYLKPLVSFLLPRQNICNRNLWLNFHYCKEFIHFRMIAICFQWKNKQYWKCKFFFTARELQFYPPNVHGEPLFHRYRNFLKHPLKHRFLLPLCWLMYQPMATNRLSSQGYLHFPCGTWEQIPQGIQDEQAITLQINH